MKNVSPAGYNEGKAGASAIAGLCLASWEPGCPWTVHPRVTLTTQGRAKEVSDLTSLMLIAVLQGTGCALDHRHGWLS